MVGFQASNIDDAANSRFIDLKQPEVKEMRVNGLFEVVIENISITLL